MYLLTNWEGRMSAYWCLYILTEKQIFYHQSEPNLVNNKHFINDH